MAIASYLQNALINHIAGIAPYTQPTGLYLGLHTSSSGGYAVEVNNFNYKRVKIDFYSAGSGTLYNSSDVIFAEAGISWGKIMSVGIYDSLTAGNLLFVAELTVNPTVEPGTQLIFKRNYISISLL